MAMWSMWSAPLEIAADLRSIPPASAAILKNPEVIRVNQDPLVSQARRVYKHADGMQLWRKRLVDDSLAVALFNGGAASRAGVQLAFEDVGFTDVDRVAVRDLVRQVDLGMHVGRLVLAEPIPSHGVVLLNVSVVWPEADHIDTRTTPLPDQTPRFSCDPFPSQVVDAPAVRFTVLTPRVIRMQSAPFDDRCSFAITNRKPPRARFTSRRTGSLLTITTELLTLRYNVSAQQLTPGALSIQLMNSSNTWRIGDRDVGNLGGTISSWNEIQPSQLTAGEVQPGLLSRDGWALIIDTAPAPNRTDPTVGGATARFENSGKETWVDGSPWLAKPTAGADLSAGGGFDGYFFGCGSAYRACLGDWATLSGPIPLPPKQTFGTWWSKYQPFSAESIETLVLSEFTRRSLPLDVLQMDVDWHVRPKHAPHCNGFNGYDWNASLFADPNAFVATVRGGNWSNGGPQRPLKLLLNTHSFQGVDICCAEFSSIAKAIGHTDPNLPIPFNMSDRATMQSIYTALLAVNSSGTKTHGNRPDYWWTDGAIKQWGQQVGWLSNAGNLMWNVHLHAGWIRSASPAGHGNRPIVMSRYGGLG